MTNFKYAQNIKECQFYLNNWKSYITIQYGLYKRSEQTMLIWKIKGTEKVFTIDLHVVTENHGSNYEEHFKLTLNMFRKDLLDWHKEGLKQDWMKKYWNEFKDLIVT